MNIVNHFFGDNGFEAVLVEEKGKFKAGWKGKSGTEFSFVRCEFKSRKWPYKLWSSKGSSNVRVDPLTTLSAALKAFRELIKEHKTVNIK